MGEELWDVQIDQSRMAVGAATLTSARLGLRMAFAVLAPTI